MSLDRLLGTWDVSMNHVAIPETVRGRQTYERVLDDAFILMRATMEHPLVPDALALLEPERYHYFDVRGVTRVYELEVDDASWSMIRRDADFWQRSSVSFTGPEEMTGTGDNSHDEGVTWEHDYSITYRRVP
jgi:hypothetical protein